MKRLGLMVGLAAVALGGACSQSHGGDSDGGGITFDARFPDSGPSAEELCGNGRLDRGEMCDDGNDVAGDGCDEGCLREPYCGDGLEAEGEACDDGNNRSGDGCRSDCLSDETCGNGILDSAAGEICDSTPSCGPECVTVAGCGDGTVAEPEECDDGAVEPWDGCDAACREEVALVLDSLSLAERGTGCDYSGDGVPDNAFATALGLIAPVIGQFIEMAVQSGDNRVLLSFLGLDDPLGANDEDVRVAWLFGSDADDDSSNDFSGMGRFVVSPDSFETDGAPSVSVQSQIAMRALTGGPEDIPLPFVPIPLELEQGRVEGTTVAAGGSLYQIEDGLLCGGIPANVLALLGGFLGDMFETSPACDGGASPALLDVIIAGGTGIFNFGGSMIEVRFRATPPDLDLDGDGLETFEVERDGPADCQPVVVSCRDGDGTEIPGRGCFSAPEVADGYTSAFEFTAIQAQLAGLETP